MVRSVFGFAHGSRVRPTAVLWVAFVVVFAWSARSQAQTIIGTGTDSLLNGEEFGGRVFTDLTDPEDDANGISQFLNGFVTATFNEGMVNQNSPTENAHNLFENNVGGGANKWCCSGPPQSVTFQFSGGEAFPVDAFTLTSGNDVPDRDPLSFQLLGSNDGMTFDPIFQRTSDTSPFTARNQVVLFDESNFTNDTSYEYVRFQVDDTVGGFQLNEIELFADGFTGGPNIIPPNPPGEPIPGLMGNDLTDLGDDGDETAYNPPDSLGGFDAVFSSTDEPGFGGGEFSFNVFDNVVGGGNAKWCCNDPGGDGHQLDAELLEPYILEEFTLTSSNDTPGRDPSVFSIEGSNDGVNFETIFSYDGAEGPLWNARNQTLLFQAGVDFDEPTTAYRIFRFNVADTVSGGYALNEIEYFGRQQSARVIPEPNSWLLASSAVALLGWRRRWRATSP